MAMVFGTLLHTGCKPDHAVDIPSYITIEAVDLQVDYTTQGTSNHKILDVWVLVGDQDLGAYELPATFPVMLEGTQEVRIFGGIKASGFSSVRITYPFYESTTISAKLIPGAAVTLEPEVSYYSDINFAWLEDFETGSTVQSLAISDTSLTLETPPSDTSMGLKCAVIRVDATNNFYAGATNQKNFVPPLGKPTYLELNYMSNIELSIGAIKHTFIGDETISPFITLFPSDNWNKIYLDLVQYLNKHTDALSFDIYFSCNHDATVADNIVRIDNVKLIYQ
ncbi:MAG: hypothetical protein JKX73_06125 [Flavobacteriales bacterium]|nr:hypothetical protein [Flavobacteriales bacterium]